MTPLEKSLLNLVRRATTTLSHDVMVALDRITKDEEQESNARLALDVVKESIQLSAEGNKPLSMEPLSAHFFVFHPPNYKNCPVSSAPECRHAINEAMAQATKDGFLAEGLTDPISGKTVKRNVGIGHPFYHFEEREDLEQLEVRLLLKSGVIDNPGDQYYLPNKEIKATRDLEGVRRAALDMLVRYQGSCVGPGVLGISIGGDRTNGFLMAHKQLLRPLNERNRSKTLAALEAQILRDANSLGIGPMGFGGKGALLSVKIGSQAIVASSFLVSICYIGWACMRQGILLDNKGEISDWVYEAPRALAGLNKELDENMSLEPSSEEEDSEPDSQPEDSEDESAEESETSEELTPKESPPETDSAAEKPAKAAKKKATKKKAAKKKAAKKASGKKSS